MDEKRAKKIPLTVLFCARAHGSSTRAEGQNGEREMGMKIA